MSFRKALLITRAHFNDNSRLELLWFDGFIAGHILPKKSGGWFVSAEHVLTLRQVHAAMAENRAHFRFALFNYLELVFFRRYIY